MCSSAEWVVKGKSKKFGTISILPAIVVFAINLWVSAFHYLFFFPHLEAHIIR